MEAINALKPAADSMNTPNCLTKTQLRAFYRQRLSALPDDRRNMDASIVRNLCSVCAEQTAAEGLAAFIPIQREPGVMAFLRQWLCSGKALYLPRFSCETTAYEMVKICCLETELCLGRYDIPEPIPSLIGARPPFHAPLNWIWLVPGLAFDLSGNRLGRGGGYYDRLLEGAGGVKIGVAYDCQLADFLSSDIHDIPMDCVVTDRRIIRADTPQHSAGDPC